MTLNVQPIVEVEKFSHGGPNNDLIYTLPLAIADVAWSLLLNAVQGPCARFAELSSGDLLPGNLFSKSRNFLRTPSFCVPSVQNFFVRVFYVLYVLTFVFLTLAVVVIYYFAMILWFYIKVPVPVRASSCEQHPSF